MSSKKHFVRSFCSGLIPKTAFTIGWMAVVAGVLSLSVTAAVTRDRAEANSARELGELLDTVESTVRIACFVEDQTLATEVVRGMLKNSKVLGVAIRANNRELARSYRASPGATDDIAEFSGLVKGGANGRLTRRVASPFNPEQTVGEIVLDPDPAAISQRVADDVKFVGLLLGAQWLVIGGGLLALVLFNVVRPIKIISDHLHRMDAELGERLSPPAGQDRTEIGRLVADINALASRLVAAIDHATEQTRQLQEAKERVDAQARQLEVKNAALARAVQVQEEVERIARHDLKTPLSSIAAVPALLRRGRRRSEEEEALLSMIENSAKRVLRMVSLSLDLFRMEEGAYAFQPKAVDIVALVLAVTRDLANEAQSRAVDIRISGHAPQTFVHAEEILCYSILANLLKNAVEAAPERTMVRISIEAGELVRLSIHNDGAVPLPVRASFFEKYATHGKSQGTGLGTYSARLMARVQHGELTMETSEMAGTTLVLELLPLPEGAVPSELPGAGSSVPTASSATAIPALRILLVDDDPDNTLIMKLFLPSPPLEVETAGNGRDAVEACRRRRPDVIFMDLEMPVMDGCEALQWIRALQAERGDAPSKIVAFSAHDDEASRRRSVAAGFDLHLSKPSSQGEILALLAGTKARCGNTDVLPEAAPTTTVWVDEDLFEAIPGFLESRRTLVALVRQSLASGNRESVRQLAHKLTGSFGMYGFVRAAQICRELEDKHRSADPGWLARQVDALERHLTHVAVRSRTGVRGVSTDNNRG
ncbi:MAG: response regulator [Rhodocyclales bacterium]|nr:response regulator [Rhodocyclales bacterium]